VKDPYDKFLGELPWADITMKQRREKLLTNEQSKNQLDVENTVLPPVESGEDEGPRKTRVFRQRAIDIIHGGKPDSRDMPRDNLLIQPRSEKNGE